MSPPDGAEAIRRIVDMAEEVKPEPQPAYVSFGKYRMSAKGLSFDDLRAI